VRFNFTTNINDYKLKIQTTRLNNFVICLILFLSGSKVCAQIADRNDSLQYFSVGYQSIYSFDSSRIYKPGVPASDKLHYRPLEMDVWYPAAHTESKTPIKYGDFLNLLEQRSNRFQDDTVYKSLTSELVQYLAINLKISDTSAILRMKTSSFLEAEHVRQKFPLILYMSAYNGMSYENLHLFEKLAGHGYIVACITSVGRYPGNMSMNMADLMEQVHDGSFTLNYLKPLVDIDSTKIGVMGYSWGGLASFVLALGNPDIKAVLSLDGSEMYYYGESKEEDNDFDELRNSNFLRLNNFQAPYIYMESGSKQNDRRADSIFNVLPSIGYPKRYIHFLKATHEDFSSLSLLQVSNSEVTTNTSLLNNQINQLTLGYFDEYLKNKHSLLSQQLNFIFQQHIADSVYPAKSRDKKPDFVMRGRIVDSENNEAVAYVNIGIPGKNIGTVSRKDGNFQMAVDSNLITDSLKISMAGYLSLTISISDLSKQSSLIIIRIKERFSDLKEVVVTKKTLPVKTMGNTTTSKFISIGLPLKFLGSEIGVKIRLGKDPVLLKSFSFNISDNRLDTAVFRMNIYSFKKGVPNENVLHKNILVPVGKRTGLYTVNLNEYKLAMKGDILLSLEWIEGYYSGPGNGALFLSAGFLNSATWHRITSQGDWKKATGLGVGLNMEIQKLPVQ
jgi:pimeloyl-ACP methyl ester carboxylesterase